MASWLHLTLGLGLLMGRDDDWLRSNSTCLLLLVQKMARSLSLYSACIPWGLLRHDSRHWGSPVSARLTRCEVQAVWRLRGQGCSLRAAASTEPWLLAARSPPLAGRAPAWPTTYRELSRLGVISYHDKVSTRASQS